MSLQSNVTEKLYTCVRITNMIVQDNKVHCNLDRDNVAYLEP